MTSTRDQIVGAACELLESQGFHATGLNQILKESGAPKGSLYYYFPDGKDELAEEAIGRAGAAVSERIRDGLGAVNDPAEAVRQFVTTIAHYVEASQFQNGGPFMTVAMETATTNTRLNLACRAAYDQVQAAFKAKLLESGYSESLSVTLATFITASIEGGVMLCRTYHTGEPLRLVATQLSEMLKTARPTAHTPGCDDVGHSEN